MDLSELVAEAIVWTIRFTIARVIYLRLKALAIYLYHRWKEKP